MLIIIGCGNCGKLSGQIFGHFILHILYRFIHGIFHLSSPADFVSYLAVFQLIYFCKRLIMCGFIHILWKTFSLWKKVGEKPWNKCLFLVEKWGNKRENCGETLKKIIFLKGFRVIPFSLGFSLRFPPLIHRVIHRDLIAGKRRLSGRFFGYGPLKPRERGAPEKMKKKREGCWEECKIWQKWDCWHWEKWID